MYYLYKIIYSLLDMESSNKPVVSDGSRILRRNNVNAPSVAILPSDEIIDSNIEQAVQAITLPELVKSDVTNKSIKISSPTKRKKPQVAPDKE